jgi:hypothetical protein
MQYYVIFSKLIWGVPFRIASIHVLKARSADRALQAATLRLSRKAGLTDWRERADTAEVESL